MSTSTSDKPAADPYREKNIDNVSLKEKIEDLSEFISKCKFGMMTTHHGQTGALVSRCMGLAAKENNGVDLIFHTNTSSGKTTDISHDPHVNISFLNSLGEWASISGTSSMITDRATIKKYYSPALKAWLGDLGDGVHDGGPEDPRIGVIRVRTNTATYAIARRGGRWGVEEQVRRGELGGEMEGETPQVTRLREVNEQEIERWRRGEKE